MEDLRDLVEAGDPLDVLTALYGPDHESQVRQSRNLDVWAARSAPPALNVADFLAPALADRFAFDGRGRTRFERTSGWWRRTDAGTWEPASAYDLVRACRDVCNDLLKLARDRRTEARTAYDRNPQDSRRRWQAVDESERLVAALSALANKAARGLSAFGDVLANLRADDRFALREDVLSSVLAAFLASATVDHGWRPGRRIEAARVWTAYTEAGAPGGFLKRELYRRLDGVLGERVDDAWRLPIGMSEAV